MSYLSFFNPLLKELGQGRAFLSRSYGIWGPDTFFHGSLHDLWGRKTSHGFGDTDVHETSKYIRISADLPGIKKEDIHVKCVGNVLTLEGERKETGELANDIYGTMERAFGSIYKSIRLPPNVDPATITAKYQDGVLTVKIPKPDITPEPMKETKILVESIVYNKHNPINTFWVHNTWVQVQDGEHIQTNSKHTFTLLPYQSEVSNHDQIE